MTAQRDADIDVESLRKSVRRPLDIFLFVSVIFLFLTVAAIAAYVATVLKPPQVPALQDRRESFQAAFKMSNFVYLEASSSELANRTMTWDVVEYGNGTSKGNLFDFNAEHHSLRPKHAGFYFIYLTLNLTCTHRGHCSSGRLSVQLGDKLTCEVDLQAGSAQVSRKCWTVSQVKSQKLLAQMTVPKHGLSDWRLEKKGSGLGLFLVD